MEVTEDDVGADIIDLDLDLDLDLSSSSSSNIIRLKDIYEPSSNELRHEIENAYNNRSTNQIVHRHLFEHISMKTMNCTYEQLLKTPYSVVLREYLYNSLEYNLSKKENKYINKRSN